MANTGVLAPYLASGNSGTISGTVTIERYIPKAFRAYRDAAPAVYNAGSIFLNWQENGSYSNNGYGIFITGGTPTSGTTNSIDANGLDKSINAVNSAYTSVGNTPSWTSIANTNNANLNPFQGYRLLVRGDRSFNLYTQPITTIGPGILLMTSATTLRATGQLVTGQVTYSTSGVSNTLTNASSSPYNSSPYGLNSINATGVPASGGYSLIANPYQCQVDWTSVLANSGTVNIQNYYYYLDPTFGSTGVYIAGNSSTYKYIQPGQAFFVQNTTGGQPTVIFQESNKVPTSTKTSIFGIEANKLPVTLLKQVGTTATPSYKKMDIANLVFDANYSNTYGNEDAPKLSSASESVSFKEGNANLSIDGINLPKATDIIALSVDKVNSADYQLEIDGTSYQANGTTPYLLDSYKKTTTAITNGVNTISFTVDTAIKSSYQNRFSIVFKLSTLPLNSITATLKNNTAIVSWNTIGETGVNSLEVEKSTDGVNFSKIATVAAKNTATASYSYTDNSATNSSVYYRIKAISADGSIAYSNIASLTANNLSLTTYNLYPNPMTGKTVNISFTNAAKGKYIVSMVNSLGQKVSEQTVTNDAGTAVHSINFKNQLATGIYQVTIVAAESKQPLYQTSVEVK